MEYVSKVSRLWVKWGREMPVQSLHFQQFALATLSQSTSNLHQGLLARPSTSVPDFTISDHTVLLAAVDFSGRINDNIRKKHMGASLLGPQLMQ